jgi:hypothetical protein
MKQNTLICLRLRLLSTFLPPLERHDLCLNAERSGTCECCVSELGLQAIGLRRAELVEKSWIAFGCLCLLAVVISIRFFSEQFFTGEHPQKIFVAKSNEISQHCSAINMKTLIQAENYEAMLFSGMFGNEPDCHSDILDIDDVFLKYSSGGENHSLSLIKLSPTSGLVFLTVRRDQVNHLLLVPFIELDTEIIKLNLIVRGLPTALAA